MTCSCRSGAVGEAKVPAMTHRRNLQWGNMSAPLLQGLCPILTNNHRILDQRRRTDTERTVHRVLQQVKIPVLDTGEFKHDTMRHPLGEILPAVILADLHRQHIRLPCTGWLQTCRFQSGQVCKVVLELPPRDRVVVLEEYNVRDALLVGNRHGIG